MNTQLYEPLSYISQLFTEHISNGSTPATFDPSGSYLDLLKNHKNKITSINDVPVQQVPPNTLVRFRCMIQDNGLGSEMFVSVYEKLDKNGDKQLHCYRYTEDPIDLTEFDDRNAFQNDHISERSLVYCVSPPGENNWSKQAHNSTSEPLSDQFNQLEINSDTDSVASKKFPIPGKHHTSAVVKFYNDMGDSVKVGQLVEIIGLRGQDVQKLPESEHEFETALNMFTGMPVLHAIAYHPLEAVNSSPHADQSNNVFANASHTREQLVNYLASALGGDHLAAEFVLLQLVSRVFIKTMGVKIGNFTLNISGFPSHETTEEDKNKPLLTMINPSSKAFTEIVDSLAIHSLGLPLTIDGLNKTKFAPKSINESLEAGLLQLVDGTILVIDETVMDEGQLVDPGVRNFQALQNLIQNQTLTYEFPYSQYELDTDISVLTLSTRKSMLPHHCTIRLDTSNQTMGETARPSEEALESFRKYIHFAKYLDYTISDEVSEYIQNRFVSDRKEASKNGTTLPSQEDLMFHMTLARLAALSFGESSLSKERFDYVVDLDLKRKSRS